MPFLKLTNDFIFKKLFTDSPNLLADLINAVLDLKEQSQIESLTILNPEISREILSDKTSIPDIRAKDYYGNQFNIEMQAFPKGPFIKRALFYWAKLYSSQLDKGDDYHKLRTVYSINFLDYKITDYPRYHTEYFLLEKNNPEIQLTEDLEIHFLELPKFTLRLMDIKKPLDLWLYTIKESDHLQEEDMKIILDKNPKMKETFSQLNHFSMDKKIKDEYEHRLMEQMAYSSDIREHFEKGIEKKERQTVLNMHKTGFDIKAIMLATNLSEEKIRSII